CGAKVVTPLSPSGWSLKYNGREIDLWPSIGNWNLSCRSHYWISNSKVRWAGLWSDEEVRDGFERDRAEKRAFYEKNAGNEVPKGETEDKTVSSINLWQKLLALLTRRRH